jgi:hypothetical protein
MSEIACHQTVFEKIEFKEGIFGFLTRRVLFSCTWISVPQSLWHLIGVSR